MIVMKRVVVKGFELPLDMEIPPGASAAIITQRERDGLALIRLILGFVPPEAGQFKACGVEPAALSDPGCSIFRRNIGVVYREGGLVSNLNAWENLTIQQEYFGDNAELDRKAKGVLDRVGYNASLTAHPSSLSLFERRLIGLARGILAKPGLMIYHSLLDGMSLEEQKHLRSLVLSCHQEETGRTSLFVTSNADSLKGMAFDQLLNIASSATGGSGSS